MNETDIQLLRRYARESSEDAFSEIVERHLPLVYSAALRQVRSPDLAQEVAQSVFVELARNAQKLPTSTIVAAWLYQVARRTAIDVVRRETRRHAREQIAQDLSAMNSNSEHWAEIEPLLDEAMQTLDEQDRAAVLLRYFSNKSLREVGEAFGASENAAQKRVTRAIEKLNEFFQKRGVRIAAAGIVAAISANVTQAVPIGLSASVTAAAFAAQSAAVSAAITTTTFTTMSVIKTAALATAIIAAVTVGVYQRQQVSALQTQLDVVKAQLQPAANAADLAADRDKALRQLAALQAENDRLNKSLPELLRLRDEVSRLKRDTNTALASNNDPSIAAAKTWVTRLNLLKARLEQSPEARVPEMKLLEEEDWLAAVKSPNLESEEDYRRAFASLRNSAANKLAPKIQQALSRYMEANNKAFPSNVGELAAYLEPKDPTLLARWEVLPSSRSVSVKMGGDWVVMQPTPIDAEFDNQFVIGPNGYGTSTFPKEGQPTEEDIDALTPAKEAFAKSNNNKEPESFEDLEPFLTTSQARAAFDKVKKFRDAHKP
jgi:RNA polymerase sigma factor (sigma-70 family)